VGIAVAIRYLRIGYAVCPAYSATELKRSHLRADPETYLQRLRINARECQGGRRKGHGPNLKFSAPPLRSLRLRGECIWTHYSPPRRRGRRDRAEKTEIRIVLA